MLDSVKCREYKKGGLAGTGHVSIACAGRTDNGYDSWLAEQPCLDRKQESIRIVGNSHSGTVAVIRRYGTTQRGCAA